MVRVYAVTLGFHANAPREALRRLGLSSGDYVVILQSLPRADNAEKAVRELTHFITNADASSLVLWLRPSALELAGRVVRSVLELACMELMGRRGSGRCTIHLSSAGGMRWLSHALYLAAVALASATPARISGASLAHWSLALEETEPVKRMFPDFDDRFYVWSADDLPTVALSSTSSSDLSLYLTLLWALAEDAYLHAKVDGELVEVVESVEEVGDLGLAERVPRLAPRSYRGVLSKPSAVAARICKVLEVGGSSSGYPYPGALPRLARELCSEDKAARERARKRVLRGLDRIASLGLARRLEGSFTLRPLGYLLA